MLLYLFAKKFLGRKVPSCLTRQGWCWHHRQVVQKFGFFSCVMIFEFFILCVKAVFVVALLAIALNNVLVQRAPIDTNGDVIHWHTHAPYITRPVRVKQSLTSIAENQLHFTGHVIGNLCYWKNRMNGKSNVWSVSPLINRASFKSRIVHNSSGHIINCWKSGLFMH